MKLVISQLSEGENRFHFESPKDGWVKTVIAEVGKGGYRVKSEMEIDLNLTKLEPDYYLRGKMKFGVEQNCDRCAEGFVLPVDHSFDVALAHVSVKAKKAELTDESEELDINFFEGNEIELVPVIEEQFFLSLPYQSICREECKGICQQCGKNLNVAECACQKNRKLTPFSVLQSYKL